MSKGTWRVMRSQWVEDKGYWLVKPASGKRHKTREAARSEMIGFQEDPRYAGYNFTIEEPLNEEEFIARFIGAWSDDKVSKKINEEIAKNFPFIKHTGKVDA